LAAIDEMQNKRGARQMNRDQLAGKWKQFRGRVKERWGKLTDDDLDTINGRSEQFVGVLQERYGIAKEAAENGIKDFLKALDSPGATDTTNDPKRMRQAG
jgi:uncharacterized protein YjbJ (UPF0337 family)